MSLLWSEAVGGPGEPPAISLRGVEGREAYPPSIPVSMTAAEAGGMPALRQCPTLKTVMGDGELTPALGMANSNAHVTAVGLLP